MQQGEVQRVELGSLAGQRQVKAVREHLSASSPLLFVHTIIIVIIVVGAAATERLQREEESAAVQEELLQQGLVAMGEREKF